jgi:hypothetical protein
MQLVVKTYIPQHLFFENLPSGSYHSTSYEPDQLLMFQFYETFVVCCDLSLVQFMCVNRV